MLGDMTVLGEAAFVGDIAMTDIGNIVNPTNVWHLLGMARRNS